MTALPRILVPRTQLTDVDGIAVALLTVELWDDGIVLRLAGLPNEATQRMLDEHEHDMTAWAERRQQSPNDTSEAPPEEPGPLILNRINIGITDEHGTSYRMMTRRTGGTGTELRDELYFQPGMPKGTNHLTIHTSGSGLPENAIQVPAT
ncbi:hypothetical protein [Haloechinothrix sp. LS1_15]|uniref:hypothetical protein n=1 Tax=Haloechinothrix sp. LS1_15 TaxID=2652248 RepID=UPI0029461676|nr:hypothetical protein [Haloechinothrix sp. LS1_15]MDV6012403.1 hypothetical protein [Haloechinothrix sp. LS1_15]